MCIHSKRSAHSRRENADYATMHVRLQVYARITYALGPDCLRQYCNKVLQCMNICLVYEYVCIDICAYHISSFLKIR